MILPEHMTVWDRNQRLYETLKSMGLFVRDPKAHRKQAMGKRV